MTTKSGYQSLSCGAGAFFALEARPENGLVLCVVEDDDIRLWRDNLAALGVFFGSPPVYEYPLSDQFARISSINSLLGNTAGVVAASNEAVLKRTYLRGTFASKRVAISLGSELRFEELIGKLAEFGYTRVDFVEDRGQFSRRGEVIDIWPPDRVGPLRLVFALNNVESIKNFEIGTQRSGELVSSFVLIPAKEGEEGALLDFLGKETVVLNFSSRGLEPDFEKFRGPSASEDGNFVSFGLIGGNFRLFASELEKYGKDGYKTVVFAQNNGEKERIEEILEENSFKGQAPEIMIGPLSEGFASSKRKLAVFSSAQVLYKKRPVSFPKFKAGRRLEGLWEINSGDYVVHEKYGIGKYLGLKKIARGEQENEYLHLMYKGGDKLYVPVDDFRIVQKYVGIEGHKPKLYSLDTAAWERAKQRAKKGAQDMAAELLRLYAARNSAQGHAFGQDNNWEKELSDSFPYEETDDQSRAIAEVKEGLMSSSPMERLVCGDVGFGKTEVAVRAAFKAVQDSKQAAVLVPTTVLAEQHWNTFSNRLSPFPVRVAMLSRFQSKKEQKQVIEGLSAGTVDVVIGTHRLLQKDVAFKDLGLLIIDEEHRFGVKQKEKIKQLKKNVDVLLLSATPIPRTLSMALSNLRDLSVIETPPYGRLPIETHLGPYDEKTVKRILEAELARGGQVFYVHNRVETIFSRAAYISKLVPDAKVAVVHGQMPAGEIEKNMWDFMHGKTDVLVATTIIESGLDIPSANTMVVEEAENFGLAQLYQLRGRIGREKQKAYCYLFYTPEFLNDESTKRLKALQEFSELGSGFRLALRDLEIRGAGNILSGRQHGFVRDIGFELYSRLIDEVSKNLKGARPGKQEEKKAKTVIDFKLAAHLPPDYVEQEDLRIMFYRRIASAETAENIESVKSELADRFGSLPEPAGNLFKLTELRLLAEKLGIKSIIEEGSFVTLFFPKDICFTQDSILALARDFSGLIEFIRGEAYGIKLKKSGMDCSPPLFVGEFIKKLAEYVPGKQT
ncbi:MAG: transcription-repair coupling factor [Endomicrobiales bacterium]|nr:transcription-repair coupling factor [Endomicrobiales bacterium]